MTAAQSYELTPAADLEKYAKILYVQGQRFLEAYSSAMAEHAIVLQALGVQALHATGDKLTLVPPLETPDSAVA